MIGLGSDREASTLLLGHLAVVGLEGCTSVEGMGLEEDHREVPSNHLII